MHGYLAGVYVIFLKTRSSWQATIIAHFRFFSYNLKIALKTKVIFNGKRFSIQYANILPQVSQQHCVDNIVYTIEHVTIFFVSRYTSRISFFKSFWLIKLLLIVTCSELKPVAFKNMSTFCPNCTLIMHWRYIYIDWLISCLQVNKELVIVCTSHL